jgi:release factor glutamine methyltransferase
VANERTDAGRPAAALRRASATLARHGVESARANAEILLASTLGTNRAGIYARAEALTAAERRAYDRVVRRRCAGTPLQHLTRDQPFRRLTVEVRPGVFIPRPETEVVVEIALEQLEGSADATIVDVGTGTGAIALAIAAERPGTRVIATDVDPNAVALARANAARLGLGVEVRGGDLLEPVRRLRGRIDLVVANPPYLSADELASLPPDVLADPEPALLPARPRLYGRLAAAAVEALRRRGALVVEVAPRLAPDVVSEFERVGLDRVAVRRDLTGRERVVVGRRR